MKNIRAYKLVTLDLQQPLRECGANELATFGWVPAFNSGQDFVEDVNDSLVFKLGMYVKKLQRKAINTEVDKRWCVNSTTDRKEIVDIVTDEFITRTFPEYDSISAYIDTENDLLVVDATSEDRASLLTALLRKTLGSLPIVAHSPSVDFSTVMTRWVQHGLPSDNFGFCDEVELKELGREGGATVRYKNIICDAPEVTKHIEDGWSVTKIRLVYDDLITFTLDKDFVLKGVKYLDRYKEHYIEQDDMYHYEKSSEYLMIETHRNVLRDLFNMFYGVN